MMNNYRLKSYWDKRYQKYGYRTVGHISLHEEKLNALNLKVAEIIRSEVNPYCCGKKILDFGCGFGRNSKIIREVTDQLYGIDINEWAIEQANLYVDGLKAQLWSGSDPLPFEDETFDGLLSWTVLQHIPPEEIDRTIEELERVVIKNGFVFLYENVSVWQKDKFHIWFRDVTDYAGRFKQCQLLYTRRYRNFDEVEEIEDHELMIFKKRGH